MLLRKRGRTQGAAHAKSQKGSYRERLPCPVIAYTNTTKALSLLSRVQAAVIEDRQSKTLLTDETLQRLRALRQRQWQKAAADFNKRQDAASARADASIAAWLAAHKERVALGMTTDGGTTTDHCDTEGMTEEVAAENAPPLVNGNGYVWDESYGGRPGWVLCIE